MGTPERMKQAVEPLKSLESVLSWHPKPDDELARGTAELSRIFRRESNAKQTLLCHDMKGGYTEDRFVEGCPAISYRFYHWQYLDIFIYFSHHFVTIPPPMWTNAAHRHGVKMLGTLITEWDDGKAMCSQFLKSSREFRGLANKMVDIMKFYNFEGWLVNIENVIEEDQVENLRDFVAYLTQRCHSEVKGSKVIWYDSVTKTGKLDWQDQVNEENQMFFEACDGIFLNYCWNEEKLKNSHSLGEAVGRERDVFVGVDVFGRGCFGDGGYNTCKAMSKIKEANLSTAIFAPGWVYETQDETCFTANQNKFWSLLHDYCSKSVLTQPSISTSFCHGFGQKYFCKGEVVSQSPWYNLSLQQIQPNCSMEGQSSEVKVMLTESEGFLGGGCLLLEGKLSQSNKPTLYCDLFQMDAKISSKLQVVYTYKNPQTLGVDLVISLTLTRAGQSLVLHLGQQTDQDKQCPAKTSKLDKEEMWISPLQKESALQTYHNVNGWQTRCYTVEESLVSDWCLQTVCVRLSGNSSQEGPATLLLGQIQIHTTSPKIASGVTELRCSHLKPNTESVSESENIEKPIDLTKKDNSVQSYLLQWDDSNLSDVHYYNVYYLTEDQDPRLVRHCVTTMCTVSVDRGSVGDLYVQTVFVNGNVTALEDSPSCCLPR